MVALPKATTSVSATAGALASGAALICILAPVPQNADIVPRQYGSADAIHTQHGYSDGIEYASEHIQRTGLPVVFVGLPIDTPGVVGREDTSGNTGSSSTTVAAGAGGVLGEHDGIVTVVDGGTIGTDQIVLGLSMDGGRTTKRVRLGTGNSYTIPYFNVTISFGAGTLVAGETIHTWHGSAPLSATADWATARLALAAQAALFRSVMLIGDLPDSTAAAAFVTQLDAYETANERFVQGRASVLDRLPLATMSKTTHKMSGNPNVTFAEVGATGDTITRSAGSFITDGFAVGDIIMIAGSASNDMTTAAAITGVTASVLTLDTDDLVDEGPVGNVTITGEDSLTFNNTGETITRSGGSWLSDGFRVGDSVTVSGTAGGTNDGTFTITALTATVMTLGAGDVDADEVIGITAVTITTGQTKAAWMTAITSGFASIDDKERVFLSAGRGRHTSSFSGWYMRRPAGWFASWREYQHDLHVNSWRKDLGNVDADLYDAAGQLVEWDDRADGSGGSGARFTTLRSWANGPRGGFIARSPTRALDSSVLVIGSNMYVVNEAQAIIQAVTENFAGRQPLLNNNGTATTDELKTLETEANSALEQGLLKNLSGEGPRASKAIWVAATDDDLSVVDAVLNGTLELNLRGTIVRVNTKIRVNSGGQ